MTITYGPFISRDQAKTQGLKQYFTGIPCHKDHAGARSTCNGSCMECVRAKYEAKKTDPAFKDRRNAVARNSYAKCRENPETVEKQRARCRDYAETDGGKQRIKEAMARFVASGAKAASDRKYAASKNGKVAKSAAKKRYKVKREAEVGMPYSTYRLKTDPQFKLHSRLSTRIQVALKRVGEVKAKKTAELTGCSVAELKRHLEAQFTEGMAWENQGAWHVDHIRPCSSFDLTDPEQQKECFHYSNLQPLWAEDNFRKSDKWEPVAA